MTESGRLELADNILRTL